MACWTGRFTAPALLVFLLSSCGSLDEGKEAEERYTFLLEHGTLGEACEAGRAVQKTYADRTDPKNYEKWKLYADIECQLASLEGADRPADSAKRAAEDAKAAEIKEAAADAALQAAGEAIDNAGRAVENAGEALEESMAAKSDPMMGSNSIVSDEPAID